MGTTTGAKIPGPLSRLEVTRDWAQTPSAFEQGPASPIKNGLSHDQITALSNKLDQFKKLYAEFEELNSQVRNCRRPGARSDAESVKDALYKKAQGDFSDAEIAYLDLNKFNLPQKFRDTAKLVLDVRKGNLYISSQSRCSMRGGQD